MLRYVVSVFASMFPKSVFGASEEATFTYGLPINARRYEVCVCLCQGRGIEDPAEIIFEMSKEERKDFYRSVAWGLNRPLFAVYRRVLRMYDNRNHVGK